MNKTINLAMPELLFEASKEYSKEYGYRTVQEFILDLVRHKVIMKDLQRIRKIEEKLDKGIGSKEFKTQKEAVDYLKNL